MPVDGHAGRRFEEELDAVHPVGLSFRSPPERVCGEELSLSKRRQLLDRHRADEPVAWSSAALAPAGAVASTSRGSRSPAATILPPHVSRRPGSR